MGRGGGNGTHGDRSIIHGSFTIADNKVWREGRHGGSSCTYLVYKSDCVPKLHHQVVASQPRGKKIALAHPLLTVEELRLIFCHV